jgi:hypothetical protein
MSETPNPSPTDPKTTTSGTGDDELTESTVDLKPSGTMSAAEATGNELTSTDDGGAERDKNSISNVR